MFSSQVSLTNLMLNIKSNNAPGLVLNKGEIVGGLVQEVKSDGNISLLIQGKLVEALSEVSVEKGQQVFLSVEDFKDGRIYLKLVTADTLAQWGESSLAESLKTIGFNADPQNLTLAKKLLQYGLPATRDNINEASRGLKVLGGYSHQNVELAVLTMAGKLPLDEPTLITISHYFSAVQDMGKLVENLSQALDKNIDTVSNSTQTPAQFSIPSRGEAAVQQAKTTSSGAHAIFVGEETSPTSSNLLQTNLPQQSEADGSNPTNPKSDDTPSQIDTTARTQSTAYTATRSAAENSINEMILPSAGQREAVSRQTLGLIQDLLKEIVINFQDDIKINTEKMEARTGETRSYVTSMETVRDLLVKLENDQTPVGRELLARLSELEKELGAQQMVNYLSRTFNGQENLNAAFYLSFPVQIDSQHRQVQLRVNRDSSQPGLKEADRLSMVVALDTLNMGRVLFHVDWARKGQLGLKGVVENPGVGSFLEGKLEGLTSALSAQGYQVDNRGIIVSSIKEEIRLRTGLEANFEDLRFLRIDITV